MLNDKDLLSIEEHLKDLRREAERDRLAHLALAGAAKRPSFVSRTLVWLGGELVHWGCQLQARYKMLELACDEAGNELTSATVQQRIY
jgi:hypothetical protein